jgi:hypothetical protein
MNMVQAAGRCIAARTGVEHLRLGVAPAAHRVEAAVQQNEQELRRATHGELAGRGGTAAGARACECVATPISRSGLPMSHERKPHAVSTIAASCEPPSHPPKTEPQCHQTGSSTGFSAVVSSGNT